MRLRPKPNATPDDLAFGVNPVAMAIERRLARSLLFLSDTTNRRVLGLIDTARQAGIPVHPADLARLDELTAGGVHQGVLVRLRPIPGIDLATLGADSRRPSLVVVLDRVTDPQNLGAVLRAAVAVGADAVVLPRRRGALLTPGVHRASAGVSFIAPVAAPQNLAQAVRELRALGYWVVAADADGGQNAIGFDWPTRTALVMGSEAEGVSRLLRDLSDFSVALPMDPRVDSLNVAVAFGALAYLWRSRVEAANARPSAG